MSKAYGKKRRGRAHGQARQSQLLTTYGPGSMIDLPRWGAVVAGLDEWIGARSFPIEEERLAAKVEQALDRRPISLFAPPVEDEEQFTGVPVYAFPRWFLALYEERRDGLPARPLVSLENLTPKRRYLDRNDKPWPVIPVRFVQACVHGHLDDIDWRGFAHNWESDCKKPLWLLERGTTGDFVDIFVYCDCGKARRSLAAALSSAEGGSALGSCRGGRPWLGEYAREKCRDADDELVPAKLLVRTASHAYFPQVLSVIHIPDHGAGLRQAIDSVWKNLSFVESLDELRIVLRGEDTRKALSAHMNDVEEIWSAVQRKKSGRAPDPKTIKQAEMETLLKSDPECSSDQPWGDYYARNLRLAPSSSGPMSVVDRVILVHRLREVRALVGFSRFAPIEPDIHGEFPEVARAPISREADWVPAVEHHGEGFFLSFREEALAEWESREAVKARIEKLREGFGRNRPIDKFPGPRYVLLHSLSHLLITAVSLECGYASASIRERVYVTGAGCGILLLTGSAGSEGTLGGLVEVGRKIERHLLAALEGGRLCTNDPVCAVHDPSNTHEERFRHGAACHGCLLIAESSCEKMNLDLDRALVVPTVTDADCAFFRDLI